MGPTTIIFASWSLLAALGQEAPQRYWYTVDLEGGRSFSAPLAGEEGEAYLFSFEGSILRVERKSIRKIVRMSALPSGSPKAGAGVSSSAGIAGSPSSAEAERAEADRLDALRNAIEALDSVENGAASDPYRTLAKEIDTARPLLHRALQHRSAGVRLLSVKLLGEAGKVEEDLRPVAGRLDDFSAEVRLAAVMSVRALGPEGLPDLLRYLRSETVPNNRKMAVKTIQRWKDPRGVSPLVELLEVETDGGVRGFIAVALGQLTGLELGADPRIWRAHLQSQENRERSRETLPGLDGRPASDRPAPGTGEER